LRPAPGGWLARALGRPAAEEEDRPSARPLSAQAAWAGVTERREASGSLDTAKLSAYLKALSVPNRLELLRKLQQPHALGDIRLAPVRRDRDRNPARAITRQAVEEHLGKLEDLGLVQARTAQREGRVVTEYVVNQARLFVVVEELRRLSLLRPVHLSATAGHATQTGRDVPALPAGPAFVLAGGPLEGTAFPLVGSGPWVVGREKDSSVPLPFDPFVSKENAKVWREGDGFLVQALAAKNGTRVNWQPLAEGEVRALKPADTLGVGRTVLLLRGA
jgi:DNA-binding transcriptional ArsR family regulator